MARRTSYSEDSDLAAMLDNTLSVNSVTVSIDAGEVLAYIADNFDPEDVFDEEVLVRWAEDNGYVKGE